MYNFDNNMTNGTYYNLWTPLLPASFENSLSYLQHIEILRNKLNEVIKELNDANFYSRGLKPGKEIEVGNNVSLTENADPLFNGEKKTLLDMVVNTTVNLSEKPGWHRVFTTKDITPDLKMGLTFLYQEQPLCDKCEPDSLGWGLLKINAVYNPTDADVDMNTHNIKVLDFAFEENRNLDNDPEVLKKFKLVSRINPCDNSKNVLELYYHVDEKKPMSECKAAAGRGATFTLIGLDNPNIEYDTYIKLDNEGLNDTTYDGITGKEYFPVINWDYDSIELIGDTEGYGDMNRRDVKVDPTTTPQLIDSLNNDPKGDVTMLRTNIPKNHRPYDDVPKYNHISMKQIVPQLIDNINVDGDVDFESIKVEKNHSDVVDNDVDIKLNIPKTVDGIELTGGVTGIVVNAGLHTETDRNNLIIETAVSSESIAKAIPIATNDRLGIVQIGEGINVTPEGVISANVNRMPVVDTIHLYIDPIEGSDDNDGLTPATPALTFSKLYDKYYYNYINLHIQSKAKETPISKTPTAVYIFGSGLTRINIHLELNGKLASSHYPIYINNCPDCQIDIDTTEVPLVDFDFKDSNIAFNLFSAKPGSKGIWNRISISSQSSHIGFSRDFASEKTPYPIKLSYIEKTTVSTETINTTSAKVAIELNQAVSSEFYNCHIYFKYQGIDTKFNNCSMIADSGIDKIVGCTLNYTGLTALQPNTMYIQNTVFNTPDLSVITDYRKGPAGNRIAPTLNDPEKMYDFTIIGDYPPSYYMDRWINSKKPTKIKGVINGTQFYNGKLNTALEVADTTRPGVVKPDGTTITVDPDGTIHSAGGGGGEYTLPQATEITLGGIKASPKGVGDTQEVKIDTASGKLYTTPGGVSEIPIATIDTLGGVKAGGKNTEIDPNTGVISFIPKDIVWNYHLIPDNVSPITYYVDYATGLDSNDGLSLDTPKKTIEGVLNDHKSTNILIRVKATGVKNKRVNMMIDCFGYNTVEIKLSTTPSELIVDTMVIKNGVVTLDTLNSEVEQLTLIDSDISMNSTSDIKSLKLINSSFTCDEPTPNKLTLSDIYFMNSTLNLRGSAADFRFNGANIRVFNSFINCVTGVGNGGAYIEFNPTSTAYIKASTISAANITMTSTDSDKFKIENCKILGDCSFDSCELINTDIYTNDSTIYTTNSILDFCNLDLKDLVSTSTIFKKCNFIGNLFTSTNISPDTSFEGCQFNLDSIFKNMEGTKNYCVFNLLTGTKENIGTCKNCLVNGEQVTQ